MTARDDQVREVLGLNKALWAELINLIDTSGVCMGGAMPFVIANHELDEQTFVPVQKVGGGEGGDEDEDDDGGRGEGGDEDEDDDGGRGEGGDEDEDDDGGRGEGGDEDEVRVLGIPGEDDFVISSTILTLLTHHFKVTYPSISPI